MAETRILIAQPTTGSVASGTVGYLTGLVQALQARGPAWDYRHLALSDIALSRNIFAILALARSYGHTGFLPPALLALLDFGGWVVAAACPKRHLGWNRLRRITAAEAARPQDGRRGSSELPDLALAYDVETRRFGGSALTAERRGVFLKVPAVGTGLMLIRRDALKIMRDRAVARPRPACRDLPLLEGKVLLDFFSPAEVPDGSLVETEGVSFCKRSAQDRGVEIWVEAASRTMHFGMRAIPAGTRRASCTTSPA